MNSWYDVPAREAATWDFCERMRKPDGEKEKCLKDPKYAKKCFAKDWFYLEGDANADPALAPIPKDTEFRVFDWDDKPGRDKLVTIVLPPEDAEFPLPSRPTKPVEDVWRCTWFPYLLVQLKGDIKDPSK